MSAALRLLLVAVALLVSGWVIRRRDRPDRPVPVLWHFWSPLLHVLSGRRLLALLAAVVLTILSVWTGADRGVEALWERWDPVGHQALWTAFVICAFWTLAFSLVLFGVGVVSRRPRIRLAGAVTLQAVLSGFVLSQTFKILTGRRGPLDPTGHHAAHFPMSLSPNDFTFDFWRRTVHDGRFYWPSGHTMTAMVFVTALWACFPEKRWIAWIGYAVVVVIACMLMDGHFHWISDILASILLGFLLGRRIGGRFRAEHDRRRGLAST